MGLVRRLNARTISGADVVIFHFDLGQIGDDYVSLFRGPGGRLTVRTSIFELQAATRATQKRDDHEMDHVFSAFKLRSLQ